MNNINLHQEVSSEQIKSLFIQMIKNLTLTMDIFRVEAEFSENLEAKAHKLKLAARAELHCLIYGYLIENIDQKITQLTYRVISRLRDFEILSGADLRWLIDEATESISKVLESENLKELIDEKEERVERTREKLQKK